MTAANIGNTSARRKRLGQNLHPHLIAPPPTPLRPRKYRHLTHQPLQSALLRARLRALATYPRKAAPAGWIQLDNNAVELAIRPLALNRKNALFAGSDEGGDNWAVIATLIENCKLAGINPHTWLTATLTSLANGHPASRIEELLPHAHVG